MTPLLFNRTYFLIFIFFSVVWPAFVWAGDDFIIILDQSASMRESQPGNPNAYQSDPLVAPKSSEAVKAINHVLSQLIKLNDYFALISFGNEANTLISQQIRHPHERNVLERQIKQMPFKDKHTDIIAGIQTAQKLLDALNTPQRRKILVLITDGKNDPSFQSPFQLPQLQDEVFKEFQQAIIRNSWNVSLVGLGVETDIDNIAGKLGLAKGRVLTLDDLRKGEIETRLRSLFERQQRSTITLSQDNIDLKLSPKLKGGYKAGQVELTLISTYPEKIMIQLDPKAPFVFSGTDRLNATISPQTLTLIPNRPSPLTLKIAYTGGRPEDGRITSSYQFNFLKQSSRFYPWQGTVEVILPSWWESFGRLAVTALFALMITILLIVKMINKANVWQVRIQVNSDQGVLGEPLTLDKGQSFSIANGYLAGPAVPAKGLKCRIAAEVKYLGRKKFEVNAKETIITQIDGATRHLIVGLDDPFSLKEEINGNVLHNIMLSFPGRHGDIFANGTNTDPF